MLPCQKELFGSSEQASFYSKCRPNPPKSLIESIISYLPPHNSGQSHEMATDIGCGTGQCASLLAPHFGHVFGFDISKEQIAEAIATNGFNNVKFNVSPAESLPLSDSSVSLVTCCQSFHWFDKDAFFTECKRILKPKGVVALITYVRANVFLSDNLAIVDGLHNVLNEIFDHELLKKHIAPHLAIVNQGYENVELPFNEVFRLEDEVIVSHVAGEDIVGYVKSWSGYNKCLKEEPEVAAQVEAILRKVLIGASNDKDLTKAMFTLRFPFRALIGR
ncbi:putative methyltransferase [Halotydeus destructor]|nr:putative methyltransferase [Halotydeus destructor]